MFEVKFRPRPEYIERTKGRNIIRHMLYQCTVDAFGGLARGAEVGLDEKTGGYSVSIEGVFASSVIARKALIQIIANNLEKYRLNTIFYISCTTQKDEVLDVLVDPTRIHVEHYPLAVLREFDLESTPIPSRFICPIATVIMNQPVFLRSNPKIFYEKDALLNWIAAHETDPFTRERMAEPGIIDAPLLQAEIYQFVMDLITEQDTSRHFHIDDGDKVVHSPTLFKPAVPQQLDNIPTLFASLKLSTEFYRLAGQALRRAASTGRIDLVEGIFSLGDTESIINLTDDNPEKRRTALHYAIAKGKDGTAVAEYLLSHGAKTDIPDAHGVTADQLMAQAEGLKDPAPK